MLSVAAPVLVRLAELIGRACYGSEREWHCLETQQEKGFSHAVTLTWRGV